LKDFLLTNEHKENKKKERVEGKRCHVKTIMRRKTEKTLDGKTGLVPGLVPGFQGWKCPGTLAQTWH
jgi:hypothetical protein